MLFPVILITKVNMARRISPLTHCCVLQTHLSTLLFRKLNLKLGGGSFVARIQCVQIFRRRHRRRHRHGAVDTVETSTSLVRKLRKPSYFNGRKAPRPEVLTLFRRRNLVRSARVASYRDIDKLAELRYLSRAPLPTHRRTVSKQLERARTTYRSGRK